MSKAVIYARYSSAGQREVSIDQQIAKCKAYAAQMSLEVVGEYVDKAMTGRNSNRPDFQRMISDSDRKEWSFVIVYAIDRFSRQKYENAIYKNKLMQNGVKVLSATEPITNDAPGILVEGIFESLAMYYSAELSNKIRRGQQYNAEHFLATGSVPFGFDRAKDGHYVINEVEAPIVREIYSRVLAGETFQRIFDDLNGRGIKTKHGHEWSRSSFNRLLSNERYIGTFISKDKKTPDALPQILDKQTFYAVQAMLPEKAKARQVEGKTSRRRTPNGIYLLTGRLYCHKCGQPMCGISGTSKSGKLHYYYTCRQNHCVPNLQRDELQQKVAESIYDIVLSDDAIAWMADNAVKTASERSNDSDRQILAEQLSEAEKAQRNIVKAIEAGAFSDALQNRLAELDSQITTIKGQLALLDADKADPVTADDIMSYLQLFRDMEIDSQITQQAIIDAFVRRVEVHDDFVRVFFSIKKEDHQTDFQLDGPIVASECSFSDSHWRQGTLKRTPEDIYFFDIPAA